MQKNQIQKYILPLLILLAVAVFMAWFFYNPVADFKASVPGLDNRPAKNDSTSEIIQIGDKFESFSTETSALKGKWTRFRGADFDNINKEKIKLLDKFPAEGPKIKWTVELGEGHAAPVIYNGKVYILDYLEKEKSDALRCFSLETGKELWRRWYKVHVKRNHGMSRTVPAITENHIVTIGPRCQVMCADPETGNYLWGIDLVKDFGTEVPFWYTGQCPLIDKNMVVLAPGGSSLLIGVDLATGNVVWKTPNPDNWAMSHSSVMPMNFGGRKMYVYFAIGGIVGISAEGDDIGKILWKINKFAPSVIAPSPLVLDDGKIFVSAGYGAGSMLFQVKKDGDEFSAKEIQIYKPKDGLASEQQTPLFYDDHLFAILPKDAGAVRNQFVCCQPGDCTKIIWTSGKTERFGLGPYIIADGKFFILDDDGTLTIAKATSTKFTLLDKVKIIDGQDAWGPFAIADGFLLMRDSKQLVCLDMRAK